MDGPTHRVDYELIRLGDLVLAHRVTVWQFTGVTWEVQEQRDMARRDQCRSLVNKLVQPPSEARRLWRSALLSERQRARAASAAA